MDFRELIPVGISLIATLFFVRKSGRGLNYVKRVKTGISGILKLANSQLSKTRATPSTIVGTEVERTHMVSNRYSALGN
jgi:hypothetical protein